MQAEMRMQLGAIESLVAAAFLMVLLTLPYALMNYSESQYGNARYLGDANAAVYDFTEMAYHGAALSGCISASDAECITAYLQDFRALYLLRGIEFVSPSCTASSGDMSNAYVRKCVFKEYSATLWYCIIVGK